MTNHTSLFVSLLGESGEHYLPGSIVLTVEIMEKVLAQLQSFLSDNS